MPRIKKSYVAGKYELKDWSDDIQFADLSKTEAKYLFILSDKLNLFKGINLIED
jgi:hypothetical protein